MSETDNTKRLDGGAGVWQEEELDNQPQMNKDTRARDHQEKGELPEDLSGVNARDPLNWPLWLKASIG